MKFVREFVYILLSFLEILVAFMRKAFEIIEFIFSNFFTYIMLPLGVIFVVGYVIYIAFGWGSYGYKYTLDYFSKVKISLKCYTQDTTKVKYYQVSESPFNEVPQDLKYYSSKRKKIVPIASFFEHIENNNAYEFRHKNTSYQINRKTLKFKTIDLKTQKLKSTRECFQVNENEFREIIDNIKRDGKKF